MSVTPFNPITKEQAAEILGVSIRTIDNYVREGQMPAPAALGRRVYWHPELFYQWLDNTLRSKSILPEPIVGQEEGAASVNLADSVPSSSRLYLQPKKSGAQRNSITGKSRGKKALDGMSARSESLLQKLAAGS